MMQTAGQDQPQRVFSSRIPETDTAEDAAGDAISRLMDMLAETTRGSRGHVRMNVWDAALSALVLSLNPNIKIIDVSEAVPYGDTEFDQVGLLNTMANLGYKTERIETRSSDIDERLLPCLFIPRGRGEQPMVVIRHDHAFDAQSRDWFDFSDHKNMHGTVVLFRKVDDTMDETSKFMRSGTGHSWFRAMMERFQGTILYVLSAGLVLNLIALATPLFIMMVYDRVISSQAGEVLPYLAMGVGIAIIAEGFLRFIRSKSLSWLGGRLDNIVSNRIFDHLIHLAPAYIERASIPSQIARIKTFESIRDFFSGSVFMSVLELPFMVIALLVIGFIAGPLVLVPVAAVVFYCLLFYVLWRQVRVSIRRAAKASSARQQFTLDTFDKAETIRSSGLAEIWAGKFRELSGREAVAQFQLGWLGIVGETLANALTVLSAVAVVGFGVNLVWAGVMSTGALVATMILVWRVLSPFYSLCTMIPRIEQLRNSVRQVNTLMNVDTEEMTAAGTSSPGRLRGRVTFTNAGLRYNRDEDPILSNISFEARPGEIVAITGENGSGKTSLLKMIKGLYLPQSGSLRLDGFDIRQLNPHDIRRNIAYIPQKPDFFQGSIAENLRFGNPLASDGEIRQALGQAKVLEDIMALPNGLQTNIGGRDGIRLSSSLEIRLSMVRAYLQDASIMLIDEQPNSILNDESGRFLHDTILRHRGRQTIFVVTYREDFLTMADTIVFLRRSLPTQIGPGLAMTERLKHMQW